LGAFNKVAPPLGQLNGYNPLVFGKRAGSTVYSKQLRIAMMSERNRHHQPWQFNHDSNRTNTNATHQT
jgi:hypothetical protein